MTLPEEQLELLRSLQAKLYGNSADPAPAGSLAPRFGDIFRFHRGQIRFGSPDKPRFALCVHEEGDPPARVHFVIGSRSDRGGPQVVLEAGEAGVWQRTHFKFFRTYDFDPTAVPSRAKYAGHVSETRKAEIRDAIQESTLTIKRLQR